MLTNLLKAKIHRVKVTEANLNYTGSITVDSELLECSGIMEYEKVQIVNVNNGARFETYTIAGERGSGVICLNGAAARCACVDDIIIIMSYALFNNDELVAHKPKVVLVDDNNKCKNLIYYKTAYNIKHLEENQD